MKLIFLITVIVLISIILLLYLILKAMSSTLLGVADGLSRGAISRSRANEKRQSYNKSFITRLFHRHTWELDMEQGRYTKNKKCYICGRTK